MKKNILILALTALTVTSSSFAYRQYTLAQQYKLQAIENEIKAQENAQLAEKNAELARMQQAMAEHQRMLAMEVQQAAEAKK